MTHRRRPGVAAASIGVVIFAAAVAVGANLGILNAADSQPVGKLSAVSTTEASVPPPAVMTPPKPQPRRLKSTSSRRRASSSVAATKVGLRLQDVTAKRGWLWALAQTSDSRLTVTFQHRSQTYTFVAVLARHGRSPRESTIPSPGPRRRPRRRAKWSWRLPRRPSEQAPPVASTHSGQSGHAEGGYDGGNADD